MSHIHDQLHHEVPAKGCLIGLLLAVPFWVLIGLLSWWICTS